MAPSTDTKKRKADASTAPKAKKARPAAPGATTVKAILSDTANYHIPESDVDIRASLVELAEYARSLEEEIESMKPKPLSKDEVEVAAEKLRKVVNSGIRKQMTWKPTCKTNSARWVYDGICSDPLIFAALLGLSEPMKTKTKKILSSDFSELMGGIVGSVRYNTLYLSGDVNVNFKQDEGTFKFSGCYGKA